MRLCSGPAAKKLKKGAFNAENKKKLTEEELKMNRQQKKKELKKSRQQADRKDMFEIICRSKHVWESLRRYTTHTGQTRVGDTLNWLVLLAD